jgi:hypothetical protein
MAIERLQLLHSGEVVYRAGGTVDCASSAGEAHAWEIHVRLSPAEVTEFEGWMEHRTPLTVDIGGDRTAAAIVGRVLPGSTVARAVLDGFGLCPYPEHLAPAEE